MEKLFNRLGQVGAAMLLGGVVLSRFVFVVDGGERAVLFDKIRGVQGKVYGEGMHFIVPFLQVSYFISITYHPIDTQDIRGKSETPDDPLHHRNQRHANCRPITENPVQTSGGQDPRNP
jgi:prohibitin 2